MYVLRFWKYVVEEQRKVQSLHRYPPHGPTSHLRSINYIWKYPQLKVTQAFKGFFDPIPGVLMAYLSIAYPFLNAIQSLLKIDPQRTADRHGRQSTTTCAKRAHNKPSH